MRRLLVLVVGLTVLSVLAGCTVAPGSSQDGRTIDLDGGVRLIVPEGAMPADAQVRGGPAATPADAPTFPGFQPPGSVEITTSVQPSAAVTVEIPVADAALADLPTTADDRILVLHKHEGDPWEPLTGRVDRVRHVVSVQTPSLSLFAASLPSLKELAAKAGEIVNGYFGGVVFRHPAPTCTGTDATRAAGYRVRSSSSDVLQWCIGTGPRGTPILKVRLNRRYPVLATMGTGLSVVDTTAGDLPVGLAQWATAHLGRPDQVTLDPGGTTTLAVDLPPGRGAALRTEFDGFAQSLVALQVALDLVLAIYGKSAGPEGIHVLFQLERADCAAKFRDVGADPGNAERVGALLGACMDLADVRGPLGAILKAAVVSTIAAMGGVIAYLVSSGSYAVDGVRGRSTYEIDVLRDGPGAPIGDTPTGGGDAGAGPPRPTSPPPPTTTAARSPCRSPGRHRPAAHPRPATR